jgi:hypothetical protein
VSDQTQEPTNPQLSQFYEVAQENSVLTITFAGNTARIHNLDPHLVDPFQMMAAGEFLIWKGKQHLALTEAMAVREAQEQQKKKPQIVTAGKIPEGFVSPDLTRG